MTLSQELWAANQDLAQACLEHLFVQGIGDGTLEQVKFAYYVGAMVLLSKSNLLTT